MGEHAPIRRPPASGQGSQQSRVKPTPVLVASLQIKIGATSEPRVDFDHCRMAYTRVKPYIENIFFSKKFVFAAPWTGKVGGNEFSDRPDEPFIRTLHINDSSDVFAKILR